MVETVFAEGWREGLFSRHLDSFAAAAVQLGYVSSTVRLELRLLENLERWLDRKRLALVNLDEQEIKRFLQKRRHQGRLRKGHARTAWRFLEHLRAKGAIPSLEPTADASPLAALRERYENYLKKERGLSPVTIAKYCHLLRRFLVDRFGDAPNAAICVRELAANDVSGCLLRDARSGRSEVCTHQVPIAGTARRVLRTIGT